MADDASLQDDAALDVHSMSKTFNGRTVLQQVDLRLAPGEIHAIVGQNGCGKSTFVKCLSGYYEPDDGAVVSVAGAALTTPYRPHEATQAGLRFVHQDLGIVPQLSVTENLRLGRGYHKALGGRIDWARESGRAGTVLRSIHCEGIAAGAPAGQLSVTSQTMVAIARAMGSADAGAAVIVLDEPSASLPEADVQLLHRSIRRAASHGAAILLISHRMSEVFELAHAVTVLRDGRKVGTYPTADLDEHRLAELIVGEAVVLQTRDAGATGQGAAEAPRLVVSGLAGGAVRELDLAVAAGEIVGIAGLRGSGRSTLARLLAGVQQRDNGTITVDGAAPEDMPGDARRRAIVYVPEDRKAHGVVSELSVQENLLLPRMKDFRGRFGRLRKVKMRAAAEQLAREYAVRPPYVQLPIRALSGGNQQKVILARWFSLDPKVAVLDEPMQGIDVGAKNEIFAIISAAADSGVAVIVVDSDFENLCRISDRILVVHEGRVIEEIAGARARQTDDVTRRVLLAHLRPTVREAS